MRAISVWILAGIVLIGGCSASWQRVATPGSDHAPRPGDRVEIARRDGALRSGVLTSVDRDSLYCASFTTAWDDVADVQVLDDEDIESQPGKYTRVELTNGRMLVGYLLRMEANEIVLTDQMQESEFSEPVETRIPRAQVATMEQGNHPASRGLNTLGVLVFVLTAALMFAVLSLDFSGN